MDAVETMRIFARVAEVQSFTGAARQLGISKAGASAAVAELEDRLGTRLLHRTTRRVQLTPDGRTAYERARALVADFEAFQGQFRQDEQALRGHLRVDLPIGIARDLVLPRLPGFLAAHPHLTVRVASTDRRVDPVQEGDDCVLRIGRLSPSSLIARPLGRLRMINCASPAYLAQHGVPRRPEDLSQHQLVYYAASGGEPDPTFEYEDPSGGPPVEVPMAGAVTVDSSPAYTAACLAGLGLIQSPEMGLGPYLERGELVAVLPEHRAVPMPVTLLYAHRRHQPERVRVFMDWLAELLRPRLMP